MNPYYFWLILFCFSAYIIATDSNAARFFFLCCSFIRIQYEKVKWWIWMNPKTPWAKYIMWRRSMRLAEDLMKELNKTRTNK